MFVGDVYHWRWPSSGSRPVVTERGHSLLVPFLTSTTYFRMVKSPRARGKQPPRPRQQNQSTAKLSDTNSDETVSPVSTNGIISSPDARLPFSSGPVLPYLEPPTGFMTLHPSARPLKGKQRAEAEREAPSITERDNPNLSIATPGGGGSVCIDSMMKH
jgi:hypothetical protein